MTRKKKTNNKEKGKIFNRNRSRPSVFKAIVQGKPPSGLPSWSSCNRGCLRSWCLSNRWSNTSRTCSRSTCNTHAGHSIRVGSFINRQSWGILQRLLDAIDAIVQNLSLVKEKKRKKKELLVPFQHHERPVSRRSRKAYLEIGGSITAVGSSTLDSGDTSALIKLDLPDAA